jgi:hypothetical protein
MQNDLSRILNVVEGFDELRRPFEKKEIDEVIKNMTVDRAPGPDGFNGLFLKKCLPVIKHEFISLLLIFMMRVLSCRT